MSKQVKKVGILTAGGLAPCLSSAIGYLIDEYTRTAPEIEIIGAREGLTVDLAAIARART